MEPADAADRLTRAEPPRWRCGCLALVVGLLVTASVPAREAGWYSAEGEPLPDTEARKFVDGFGAWLLTTANTHWSDHAAYAQRALALAAFQPVRSSSGAR